jgi:hypothetical protein
MTEENKKPREVKFYFTESELNEIDTFREKYETIHSRNHMAHLAMKYLIKKVHEAGGHLTSDGFPMEVAAESATTEERHKSAPARLYRNVKGGKKKSL